MQKVLSSLLHGLKVTLKWLSGKKNIIAGVIMTTSAYLGALEVIDTDTVVYINAIATLIFGSASIATGKLIYGK